MMDIYGLDLSEHNGNLDFDAIKKDGNTFVILRAGYGWSTSQKDRRFEEYYTKAKKAGLHIGVYWYSYARTEEEAKEEAKCFEEIIKGKTFDWGVWVDLEDADHWKANNGNPSGETQAKCANIIKEHMKNLGYFTGIYSSTYWIDHIYKGLDKTILWEANYGSNDSGIHSDHSDRALIHQYTSAYKMGNKLFDRNVAYKDISELSKKGEDEKVAEYEEVKKAVLGKKFDIDGYYGAQCWDGVFYVAERYLGGKRCHCGITRYVKDVAIQRATNGILRWCKDVGLKATLKPGDICIWGNCKACPSSHIAFYDHDNGQHDVYFLGQNQGGQGGAFNIAKISTSGIIAVFRPNAWTKSTTTSEPKPTQTTNWNTKSIPAGFKKERATFTVTVDAINVRNKPSTSGTKVAQYKKGQSFVYDCFRADKNGYIWLSYVSYSGQRRYVACGKANSKGVRCESWGTFK